MDFFHSILTLSFEKKYDYMLKQIYDYKSKNLFTINPQELETFLENPQFEMHSLVFLHIIHNIPMCNLQKIIYIYLLKFETEQILYDVKKFYETIEKFVKYFIDNDNGAKILKPLMVAVKKLEYLGLTPLHNIYLQLCLRLKMYKEGLKLAQRPIAFLSKKTCNNFILKFSIFFLKVVSQSDAHIYFYYCARIFIGLKVK